MPTPDFHYKRNITDLLRKPSKRWLLPETGWNYVGPSKAHGIDFQNSWANVGPSTVPCSWYLSEDGEVRLRGRIIQS